MLRPARRITIIFFFQCVSCDAKIAEGSVRVAIEEWEPAGTFTFTKWRHLGCFRTPK